MSSHFTGPLLDSGEDVGRAWFQNLPVQFNPDYAVLFDDFLMIGNDQTNDWTVVKDSGASVAIKADTAYGRLLLSSTATTDNDGSSIQGNEVFLPATGKNLWFETKLQVSTAADGDYFAGICQNFATDPEACLTASNRIGFQINDGDASILCKTEASDTETSVDSQINAADATDIILGFHLYSTTHVYFYVNRVLVATHTTNIPTTEMTPALMEISGSVTGTRSMSADYIGVWAER